MYKQLDYTNEIDALTLSEHTKVRRDTKEIIIKYELGIQIFRKPHKYKTKIRLKTIH